MTFADYDDFVLWVTLGIILGGRLAIAVLQSRFFAAIRWRSFMLWKGGMSFHGGFLGCVWR